MSPTHSRLHHRTLATLNHMPSPASGAASSLSAAPAASRGALRRWFDTAEVCGGGERDPYRIDWLRIAPFIGMHLACLGVVWVGFSWFALWTAVALYLGRMFAITGFYLRYFSHRSYRTSRAAQFTFALLGANCVQRGPLWWAAHHRNHHRHADTEADVHSPVTKSFFVSHMGWFLTPRSFPPTTA